MRRNVAAQQIFPNTVNRMPLEVRSAKIESDVGHLKKDAAHISENVGQLQSGLTAANSEIGKVREDVGAIKATLPHLATAVQLQGLATELHKVAHNLESRMIRWFILTALGAGTLAFTIAKLVF
jgi:PPE-repeat protein